MKRGYRAPSHKSCVITKPKLWLWDGSNLNVVLVQREHYDVTKPANYVRKQQASKKKDSRPGCELHAHPLELFILFLL
jgi:hypothetical protein